MGNIYIYLSNEEKLLFFHGKSEDGFFHIFQKIIVDKRNLNDTRSAYELRVL